MAAADIEAQRTAYASLSNEMIALVKKSGTQQRHAVLGIFAPMAMNDKGGSWLSASKESGTLISAYSMLTCGEVKETMQ